MITVMDNVILTATDIRQYFYCPRKIYFMYVLRQRVPLTVKMSHGREVHERKYRPRKKEDLGRITRYYNLYLQDEKLGLSGLVEIVEVEEGKDTAKVLEVKTSGTFDRENIPEQYVAQVAVQVLLVERCLGLRVECAGVLFDDTGEVVWLDIGDDIKSRVLRAVDKIRRIILEEELPDPTPYAERCVSCEYANICQRV